MRASGFLWTLTIAALATTPASAVDLTKIDRSIAKEPAYKNKPKYCLLVFGPQAKFRVWLVRDGDVLYVDRNGDGDLTEPAERYTGTNQWSIGDIRGADRAVYKDLRVFQDSWHMGVGVNVPGRGYQVGGEDLHGNLSFADNPKDAPVVHLGGPLQLSLESFPAEESPPRDYVPVIAVVGTPGVGKGTFAAISPPDGFKEAKFVCQATFTANRPTAKPIQLRYVFDCY